MPRYVVDTNAYVQATRDASAADALKTFYARFLPHVYLHSVVAQELLAGAITAAQKRSADREFIMPFESVGRVITPTHRTWKRSGQIVAELVRRKKLSPGGVAVSFINDCVLAASAKENDFVIVTRNTRDFAMIHTIEPFQFVAPWPKRK